MKKISGLACLGILALIMVWTLVLSLVFQVLWNIVAPALFGGPTIDYPLAVVTVLFLGIVSSFFKGVTVNK